MASIKGKKQLFFSTSPRTPERMRPEIELLTKSFSGQKWTPSLHAEFFQLLTEQEFFIGGKTPKNPAFSGRDRISRAPKPLGLVDVTPNVALTDAGKSFLYGDRSAEVFTRQLLKLQFPSPFHPDDENGFCVKPYLEIMRLIAEIGSLSKYELAVYGLQLIRWDRSEAIKEKVLDYRKRLTVSRQKISHRVFQSENAISELSMVYAEEIAAGNLRLRESGKKSLKAFLDTKFSNSKDYADAAIRYLLATELFQLNPRTGHIGIVKARLGDVTHVLSTIDRDPLQVDLAEYKKYLFNPTIPALLVDVPERVFQEAVSFFPQMADELQKVPVTMLRDMVDSHREKLRGEALAREQKELRAYASYDDIEFVFDSFDELPDKPLFLEWNTWRVFTMLNDGQIVGNFKVSEDGLPILTAPGKVADIECDYGKFAMTVEVTMSTGQLQHTMEGESVARHLGDFSRKKGKEAYCVFVAPNISDATLAHFFGLHRINISHYGGFAKIVPLTVSEMRQLLANAHSGDRKPNASDIHRFLTDAVELANQATDEKEWRQGLGERVKRAFLY